MKVYKKLIDARIELQNTEITKSGHNKFAGYKYFELGDFLPAVQSIFQMQGLVDVITFDKEMATMTIYCTEDNSSVVFTSPMASAQLKGCHEVQNLGAVETYQRRYLYVTALAIVEHDALDSSEPIKLEQKVETKVDVTLNKDFVDMMVAFGADCVSLEELSSFWKKNQKEIDRLKSQSPDLFKELQTKFAEYKFNFKE